METGEADYLLFAEGKAIATVEAKPEGYTLTGVEEQSGKYAKGLLDIYPSWGDPLPFAYESTGSETRKITAWCAAFVNWCLSQADAPHLGYATAKSWLEFGTPVAHPVYGCLTIIKPSLSTGRTTGHVAFFVKYKGNNVILLGGNQHGAVSEVPFGESMVLGYRWPTKINHYLLATTGVLT